MLRIGNLSLDGGSTLHLYLGTIRKYKMLLLLLGDSTLCRSLASISFGITRRDRTIPTPSLVPHSPPCNWRVVTATRKKRAVVVGQLP